MQLYRKVKAVEKIFNALGNEIHKFQAATGIHCIEGCGACCTKADIEAAPLEFLPLAYQLFVKHRAWEMLEKLNRNNAEDLCVFFECDSDPEKSGRCAEYPHRGLICRLFGFSSSQCRTGVVRFATCHPLKDENPQRYADINQAVSEGLAIPRGSYYYMMLNAVDGDMMTYYPINTAIKKSIETVLSYYAYRKRRAS